MTWPFVLRRTHERECYAALDRLERAVEVADSDASAYRDLWRDTVRAWSEDCRQQQADNAALREQIDAALRLITDLQETAAEQALTIEEYQLQVAVLKMERDLARVELEPFKRKHPRNAKGEFMPGTVQ